MISRYVFRVDAQEPLPPGRAYAFYSCLLSLLPREYADELHEQGETPISQCIYEEQSESYWKIHLLDQAASDVFSAVLDGLNSLSLNSGEIGLELLDKDTITADTLVEAARKINSERFFSLRFLSPTAFKQAGRYSVLPDKELILHSLMNKWNTVFPSYPLEDEDAFQMLLDGLRISDYNLRTTRFLLKDSKIPGFIGNLRIDTNLSAPLMDIWKSLLSFSECSGIGIKTALGMGGVSIPRTRI